MYLVVGCSSCSNHWIIEAEQATAGCPRCGMVRDVDKLRTLGRAPDQETARRIRTELLAESVDFDRSEPIEETGAGLEEPVVSDEELLTGKGIDPGTVEPANQSDTAGPTTTRAAIRAATGNLSNPTRDAILTAVADRRDEPPSRVERVLEAMHRDGELVLQNGEYRTA